MITIYAIVQARMGSTRLPGKVMLELCGKPVLWHVINRLKRSKYIDEIMVATSTESQNDLIRDFCERHSIPCYSGSEDDVLDRYYKAAISRNVSTEDAIIRITADCPLIDPQVVDKVIENFIENKSHYAANVIHPTYPDGLDCEVMHFYVLEKAWIHAKLKSEREHVTLYIRNHPELFKLTNVENETDLSSLRWTLDEDQDFQLIEAIYNHLYKENSMFFMQHIMNFLNDRPSLSRLNQDIVRNEGLIKSLLEDKAED